MNESAEINNPSLLGGTDNYGGPSRGRYGQQPKLINSGLGPAHQLIGAFFWATVVDDEVTISDGWVVGNIIVLSTAPDSLRTTSEAVDGDVITGMTPGQLRVCRFSVSDGTDGTYDQDYTIDGTTYHTHRRIAEISFTPTYETITPPVAPIGNDYYIPIFRYNGPGDITQLHVGTISLPTSFYGDFTN